MATNENSSDGAPKPLAWQLDYQEKIKPDIWESVCHVVYEEPQGHYAACATPITSQQELEALLKKPGVTQFRKH